MHLGYNIQQNLRLASYFSDPDQNSIKIIGKNGLKLYLILFDCILYSMNELVFENSIENVFVSQNMVNNWMERENKNKI